MRHAVKSRIVVGWMFGVCVACVWALVVLWVCGGRAKYLLLCYPQFVASAGCCASTWQWTRQEASIQEAYRIGSSDSVFGTEENQDKRNSREAWRDQGTYTGYRIQDTGYLLDSVEAPASCSTSNVQVGMAIGLTMLLDAGDWVPVTGCWILWIMRGKMPPSSAASASTTAPTASCRRKSSGVQ